LTGSSATLNDINRDQSLMLEDTGRQKNLFIKSSLKVDNYRGETLPEIVVEAESLSHNRLSPMLRSYEVTYTTPTTQNKRQFDKQQRQPKYFSTLEQARKSHIRYLTEKVASESERRLAHERLVTYLREQRRELQGD